MVHSHYDHSPVIWYVATSLGEFGSYITVLVSTLGISGGGVDGPSGGGGGKTSLSGLDSTVVTTVDFNILSREVCKLGSWVERRLISVS